MVGNLSKQSILIVALSSIFALPACASMGSLEDILRDTAGGGYSDEVRGEIRSIDGRRREIEVRSGWGTERVRFDSRTQVVYRDRRYDVSALERGDRVSIRIDDRHDRNPYARQIYVEASVSDRNGSDRNRDDRARVQRIDGRIRYVGEREGLFQVETSRDGLMTIHLGRDPSRSVRDRFRRLRRGDRVSIEGELIGNRELLIRRFR